MINTQLAQSACARLSNVLAWLGIARSSWYRRPVEQPKKPGPAPHAIPPEIEAAVKEQAQKYPWWGYKRIAVVCRRQGIEVSDGRVYRIMKRHGLLQRRRCRKGEMYQAAKLFELLPSGPNQLWQADVTYIHIAGSGWWYAVTVIDYYSRYLLALHLTPSYAAWAVEQAMEQAKREAQRIHGPLEHEPHLVTDNGSSFIARRFKAYLKNQFEHVRIQYRTPQQLGLLERFHQTLKNEEVYWRIYDGVDEARKCLHEFHRRYNDVRPHWALRPKGGGDVLTPADVYVHGQAIQLPAWQGWAKAAKAKLEQELDLEVAV